MNAIVLILTVANFLRLVKLVKWSTLLKIN